MECKKLLKKLKIKGYLVRDVALIPINHQEIIKPSHMDRQVIVIKLEEIINRIK